jgi:hypothetical protein
MGGRRATARGSDSTEYCQALSTAQRLASLDNLAKRNEEGEEQAPASCKN